MLGRYLEGSSALSSKIVGEAAPPSQRRIVNVLLPIHKLPPEILGDCFMRCLPRTPLATRGRAELAIPLILARVCSLWRSVVLSLPRLWSFLSAGPGEDDMPLHIFQDVFLPRSGDTSLSVRLAFPSNDAFAEVEKNLSDIFRSSSARWKSLSLELPSPRRIEGIIGNRAICLPALVRLELYSPELFTPDFMLDFGNGAPVLKEVALGIPLNLVQLPWDQLQVLKTAKPDRWIWHFAEYMMVLRICPNLLEVMAVVDTGPGDASFPWGHIVHRRLQTLHMQCHAISRAEVQLLWSHVTLPNLHSISVKLGGLGWDNVSFLSFISRSECMLTSLSLHSVGISEIQLVECLTVLPSLRRLALHNTLYGTSPVVLAGRGLFRTLCWHSGVYGALLPNLCDLILHSWLPFDMEALSALIQSRLPPAPPSALPKETSRAFLRRVILCAPSADSLQVAATKWMNAGLEKVALARTWEDDLGEETDGFAGLAI